MTTALEILESVEIPMDEIKKMLFEALFESTDYKYLVSFDYETGKLYYGVATTSTSENPLNLYPNTSRIGFPSPLLGNDSIADEDMFESWNEIEDDWAFQYWDDVLEHVKEETME